LSGLQLFRPQKGRLQNRARIASVDTKDQNYRGIVSGPLLGASTVSTITKHDPVRVAIVGIGLGAIDALRHWPALQVIIRDRLQILGACIPTGVDYFFTQFAEQ
jgi:hypothetical protein